MAVYLKTFPFRGRGTIALRGAMVDEVSCEHMYFQGNKASDAAPKYEISVKTLDSPLADW